MSGRCRPTPVETLKELQLGAVQGRLVDALADAFPRSLSTDALVERVYAGAREPDHARDVIVIQASYLRRKLARYGWTIPTCQRGRGNIGLYKLEPLT